MDFRKLSPIKYKPETIFVMSFPHLSIQTYLVASKFSISHSSLKVLVLQTFQLVKTKLFVRAKRIIKGHRENTVASDLFDPYFLQGAALSNRGCKLQHASQYPINAPCLNKPFRSIHPSLTLSTKNMPCISPQHLSTSQAPSTGGARQQLIPCT
jgi:hypothetical protein